MSLSDSSASSRKSEPGVLRDQPDVTAASPRVSVIVPTHKRPALLERALVSLEKQTFLNFEVIVVENGCPPEAEKIAARFQERGMRIRYFYEPVPSLPKARNIGIAHALGEFIAHLDDDDEWEPSKLEVQVKFLQKVHDAGAVGCAVKMINEKGELCRTKTTDWHGEVTLEVLLRQGSVIYSPSCILVRRELHHKIGLFDESCRYAHDYQFYMKIVRAARLFSLQDALVSYHVHAGNMSHHSLVGTHREVLGILRAARRDAPGDAAQFSEAIKRRNVSLCGQAVEAIEKGDPTRGAQLLRTALGADPLIGLSIRWGRLDLPLYHALRPYGALLRAWFRGLFLKQKRKAGAISKKKAGIFLYGKGLGGNGRYVESLLSGLEFDSADVTVFLYCPESEDRARFVSRIEALGAKIFPLNEEALPVPGGPEGRALGPGTPLQTSADSSPRPAARTPAGWIGQLKLVLYYLKLTFTLRNFFAAQKLDVFFLSLGTFPTLPHVCAAAALTGIKRKAMIIHLFDEPRRLRPVERFLTQLVLRARFPVLALSKVMKSSLIRHYGFSSRRVQVIYNGVDPDASSCEVSCALYDQEFDLPPGTQPILVPARFHPVKGHEILLQALNQHESRLESCIFLLAGEGPIEEQLKAKVRTLRLQERVKFIGFRADIPALAAYCRFTVLPSYNEGVPFVLLEAMAAGKAVIATDVGGVKEVVDSSCGYVVRPGDPEELGTALVRMAHLTQNEIRAMGIRAREKVLRLFTVQAMTGKTLALLGLDCKKAVLKVQAS